MRKLFVCLLLSATVAVAAEEIRLLSYNVRHAVDGNNKPALPQQAAIIKNADAHVTGLQEIDRNCRRSGAVDQVAKFAELAGGEGVFGKFMDYNGGQYGMAMLSRLPIVSREVVKLPAGREPRVAIVLVVKTPAGTELQIANVHFDWTVPKLRTPQAKALLAHLGKRDLPTIVLGDYNAEPGSPTLKLFAEAGFLFAAKPADDRFTWNAKAPSIEIDHVAVRDGGGIRLTAESCRVLNEPEASDHRPVAATIHLRPE